MGGQNQLMLQELMNQAQQQGGGGMGMMPGMGGAPQQAMGQPQPVNPLLQLAVELMMQGRYPSQKTGPNGQVSGENPAYKIAALAQSALKQGGMGYGRG